MRHIEIDIQVMRRTAATEQQEHGGLESVEGPLRHTTVQTTFELYAQTLISRKWWSQPGKK